MILSPIDTPSLTIIWFFNFLIILIFLISILLFLSTIKSSLLAVNEIFGITKISSKNFPLIFASTNRPTGNVIWSSSKKSFLKFAINLIILVTGSMTPSTRSIFPFQICTFPLYGALMVTSDFWLSFNFLPSIGMSKNSKSLSFIGSVISIWLDV